MAHYSKVRCEQVYPGIDVVYYGNEEARLEYDFELAPGADPDRIGLAFSGARRVELAPNGDLLLHTQAGTLRQHRPIAYQLVDGRPVPVRTRYILTSYPRSGGGKGAMGPGRRGAEARRFAASTRPFVHSSTHVRFELGDHDPTLPLVIDPVLAYSSYLGGSARDQAAAVAVDTAGNVYLSGPTESPDFPTTPGTLDASRGGPNDLFVAKLDPSGSTLLYATYLGGSGQDWQLFESRIAVGADGGVLLAGNTDSPDFPVFNAVQPTHGGGLVDAFVAKLNSSGSALVYSTYLGGSRDEHASAVAVDGAAQASVVGETTSNNFPTVNPIQPTNRGEQGGGITADGFVARFSATGTSLVYSTYLGGRIWDTAMDVALDADGNTWIAGGTESTDFPTVNALQPVLAGSYDAFLARINSTGSALTYSSFPGGTNWDRAAAVAVGSDGSVFVTGGSQSSNFPTANAIQPVPGGVGPGMNDAFVAQFDPTGSTLVYSTYLGGSASEGGRGLAVDSSGSVYVAGVTLSDDFPVVAPIQATFGGDRDAIVARLAPGGTHLVYSTYLGGSSFDNGTDIALAPSGDVWVAGYTGSADFPVVGPYQATHGGVEDGWLARISDTPPPPPPAAPTGLTAVATSSSRVELAWTDNAGNEEGFRVQRTSGGAFATIATLPPNANSYADTGVSVNVSYTYRVLAFNSGGGVTSNQASVRTLGVPTGLVATSLSQDRIRLTWADGSVGEEGFEIWRSTGSGFTLHAGVGPNIITFTDLGLTANTLYFYQVRAVAENSDSDFSNQAGATTLPNPPTAPQNLTATATSTTAIQLAWSDTSADETNFLVEHSADGGTTFSPLATLPANTTGHVSGGLAPQSTHHYRVKARNAGGDSAYSNIAFATTHQSPPSAPTNLTATALSSSEIRLAWNDVSGEAGFRIERRQGNDPFALLVEVGANTTTHTDGGLQPNKVYVYRVLAFNQAGNSDWSNEASARTLRSRPGPPHSLTAAAISATQVDLAWGDDNEDEQGFLLERSENTGVSWSQVGSLPANITRASDTSAQGGKNYQYRLKAWNDVGQSDPSNVASVSTPAAVALASLTVTPTAVRGRRNATGKVTITGPAPSGGVSVTLASSNAAAVVPSSVTVPAGATEATFTVTTARVRRNTRVTLTATLGAVQKTATLTVRK